MRSAGALCPASALTRSTDAEGAALEKITALLERRQSRSYIGERLVERTTLLTESQDEIGERLAAEAALHGWPPNAGGWELQDAL